MKAAVAVVVLCLIGFVLVATGTVSLPDIASMNRFFRPEPAMSLPKVDLKSLRSQYGFLEGSFVVRNTNAFPISDAAIHCDVNGPGGAVVHSFDFVLHERIQANEERTVENYKFGFAPQQGSQMICRSTSVERR